MSHDSMCHLCRSHSAPVPAPGLMVYPQLCGASLPDWCHTSFCESHGYRPFYEYYQIGRADESDEAETEPKGEDELTSGYESSHSIFGFIWQIADVTGWSVDYILNKVNYQTLIMMLSDAPHYKKTNKSPKSSSGNNIVNATPEEQAAEVAGFFKSNLKH